MQPLLKPREEFKPLLSSDRLPWNRRARRYASARATQTPRSFAWSFATQIDV